MLPTKLVRSFLICVFAATGKYPPPRGVRTFVYPTQEDQL